MPGVIVRTATIAGPSATLRQASGQLFLAGITERGSITEPILVRGMAEAESLMGARVSYGSIHDQLSTFFAEGGQQAYVARVVGATASVGSLTLVDTAGTPQNTLRVDAANPGAWSTGVTVAVADGSVTNSFKITIALNGVTVHEENNILTPAEAVLRFASSPYVRVTNLGSATAAPNNNPDTPTGPTALSAGNDQRGSVVDADYVTALARFVPDLGDGAVAVPGRFSNTVWVGINAHCVANNRIGLLAAQVSETKGNLLTRSAEVNSEYCGIFTPWIRISDGAGSYRTVSPEGYVAAVRARAHDQIGPWRVPAGELARANTLVGLDVTYNSTDANDLDSSRVSVIRNIANSIRLYGWRSLRSTDNEYKLLHNRDLLNRLVVDGQRRLESFVFAPIDSKGQLLAAVNASIVGMVDPIARQNGLYPLLDSNGNMVDPGYKVVTDGTVNSPASLANDQIYAKLLVRIAPSGSLVTLTIYKVNNQTGF